MLELGVLRELSKSASSGVTSVKKIIHLALDPGYADRVNQGITDCLGSHLHQYYPGVSGVLLGYEGVKLKKNAVMNRELPHIHLDIQATFYTFCPSPGSFLLGTVHKISEGHVGLWVHHVFYASILKKTEAAAVWAGSKLSVGDTVKFIVLAVSYRANRIIILGEGIEQSTTTTSTLQAKAASPRHKMIEHFPTRRSERKSKAEILKEKMEVIEARLLATDDSNLGLEVTFKEDKGRGIKAVRDFCKGEVVVEYTGDLIDSEIAKDRETKYSMDTSTGCYMYYFKHKDKSYCIDATSESGRFGRLVNHSRVTPNCVTKVVTLGNTPRLILVAKSDIVAGTEVLYNYGDTDKESLKAHPWLSL